MPILQLTLLHSQFGGLKLARMQQCWQEGANVPPGPLLVWAACIAHREDLGRSRGSVKRPITMSLTKVLPQVVSDQRSTAAACASGVHRVDGEEEKNSKTNSSRTADYKNL
eukprot:1894111-Pyramimonas_sp.AAC.4